MTWITEMNYARHMAILRYNKIATLDNGNFFDQVAGYFARILARKEFWGYNSEAITDEEAKALL
jgi:hypothetical protein